MIVWYLVIVMVLAGPVRQPVWFGQKTQCEEQAAHLRAGGMLDHDGYDTAYCVPMRVAVSK